MEWGDYEPYDPGSWGPLQDLPQAEARRAFERLMATRLERIEQLRRLVALHGLELRGDEETIQRLNDWIVESVEPSPKKRTQPTNPWFSVVNDLALFLGEFLIERSGGRLRWEFFLGDKSTGGKSNVSYQRHVLMGFPRAGNANYCLDVDRLVANAVVDALGKSKKGREAARSAFSRLLTFAQKYM